MPLITPSLASGSAAMLLTKEAAYFATPAAFDMFSAFSPFVSRAFCVFLLQTLIFLYRHFSSFLLFIFITD